MGDFIVTRIANSRAVVYGEVMSKRRPSDPQAIAAVVENAHRASQGGTRTCVVLDDPSGGQGMVWDPARDSFSKG